MPNFILTFILPFCERNEMNYNQNKRRALTHIKLTIGRGLVIFFSAFINK